MHRAKLKIGPLANHRFSIQLAIKSQQFDRKDAILQDRTIDIQNVPEILNVNQNI